MLTDVVPLIPAAAKCPPSITYTSKDPLLRLLPLSKSRPKHRPEDDISVHSSSQVESLIPEESTPRQASNPVINGLSPKTTLTDLPPEIQDGIIGYVYGALQSTTSEGPRVGNGARDWSKLMRHPRRRQISDLALVTRCFRILVQQRIYRHIQVKGTKAELEKCGDWFLTHSHLQPYVRHFDVWVPVWEIKSARYDGQTGMALPTTLTPQHLASNMPRAQDSSGLAEDPTVTQTYQCATQTATLEEILACAKALFPNACALTIEGGFCNKPNRIQHFREPRPSPPVSIEASVSSVTNKCQLLSASGVENSQPTRRLSTGRQLPEHTSIKTLLLNGAWNIVRDDVDFHVLFFALPKLREWHCSFSKPKVEAYQAMCTILKSFPPTIVHLNLQLESLSAKDPAASEKWRKLYPTYHICHDLGRICPQLETLCYTGRICHCLFQTAQKASTGYAGRCGLKSIDLSVSNCCRDHTETYSDGTGISNWNFIQCFEKLVTESVAALQIYDQVSFLRIRFLDLDSADPFLDPYFQLHGLKCTGIWSDTIISLLNTVRHGATFEGDLSDDPIIDSRIRAIEGRTSKKTKPLTIKVSRYRDCANFIWD
ncbi:hypothetical protein MMC31_001405 [Peltigera leucophlebia]|nr:hypothetical protein [Peltigera leucophlebia]